MAALSALMRKTWYAVAGVPRHVRAQSPLKIAFVFGFAAFFEAGLFAAFLDGFNFMEKIGGIGLMIVSHLFALFFLAMGAMLAVSGVITSYSTMFRSDEIPFLLVRPIRTSHVAMYKFLQSCVLSSWAFFFIVLPFMGAYAWHERHSPILALWTLLFSVPFLVLCSGLGAVVVMLAVRWCPRRRLRRVIGAGVLAVAGAALWSLAYGVREMGSGDQLNLARIVPGLRMASHPLMPSWWASEGIMALANRDWGRGFMLWAVLMSNSLMLLVLVEWLGRIAFLRAWQRDETGSERAPRKSALFSLANAVCSFMPRDARAMAAKDIVSFFRDPMQWSQALIFFGLLALYFSHIRTFSYHMWAERWRNAIACLNVFSVSAVMCSLGSRFLYPQLSLEGHAFWIVGLSPTPIRRILMTKFGVAVAALLPVSAGLMLLSSRMLNVSPAASAAAVALACAMSFAVCGLSTGLGAIFLDLRQRNPAAIVSGFGGTLNLVLCLLFMLAAIIPFGFFFHHYAFLDITLRQFRLGLAASSGWLVLLTIAATALPLWVGAVSLRRRDF